MPLPIERDRDATEWRERAERVVRDILTQHSDALRLGSARITLQELQLSIQRAIEAQHFDVSSVTVTITPEIYIECQVVLWVPFTGEVGMGETTRRDRVCWVISLSGTPPLQESPKINATPDKLNKLFALAKEGDPMTSRVDGHEGTKITLALTGDNAVDLLRVLRDFAESEGVAVSLALIVPKKKP